MAHSRLLTTVFALALIVLGVTVAQAAELVMFEAPGCPWCARWRAEVGPGYPHSDEGKRAPLRPIALEQASSAGIKLASPVIVSPTFVLVDQGHEVGRIVGYPGADFFWGMLDQIMVKLDKASQLTGPRQRSALVLSAPPTLQR